MAQINRWCYYDEYQPFRKFPFNDQMKQEIDKAFKAYKETHASQAKINGVDFNFSKMECSSQGKRYVLSPNSGCVPYNVPLGGDPEGLSQSDRDALSKVDPTKVVHKWLWWDNPGGADPFALYKRYAATNPMWTHYSPPEEAKIEGYYRANPNKTGPQRISDAYCILFCCIYEGTYKITIQGRNDDERNKSVTEKKKRRRPAVRATYCWCWDNSDGMGDPVWTPYEPAITNVLEVSYLNGVPEADIVLGGVEYSVNFMQGIQFSIADTSKKRRIARFGTNVVDAFKQSIGKYDASAEKPKFPVPESWEKPQEGPFIVSKKLNQGEFNGIEQLVKAFKQRKYYFFFI